MFTYRNIFGITLLLSIAVFWVGIRHHPIMSIDAGIRAQEARTIVETGSWFPILYEGQPVADHPPLVIWASAIGMKIFGVNDFGAQIAGRLFAVFSVLATLFVAWAARMRPVQALIAVLILLTTRDFILNGVRGYLEPFLQTFMYLGLGFVLIQRRESAVFWPSLFAGLMTFGAFFSKGPPAFLGLVYFPFLLWIHGENQRERVFRVLYFVFGFFSLLVVAFGLSWILGFEKYWQIYWHDQVMMSAVEGRGGHQDFEPFYFLKILVMHYWPWLPLLVYSFFQMSLRDYKKVRSIWVQPHWVVGFLGVGFFLGFSLVRWKYWYYTVPAYPAFALMMAMMIPPHIEKKVENPKLIRFLALGSIAWAFVVLLFPVSLSRIRVPEAWDLQAAIPSLVPEDQSIWVLRSNLDPNLLGTVGGWYWRRPVRAVTSEAAFFEREGKKRPLWILTTPGICDGQLGGGALGGTVGGGQPAWCAESRSRLNYRQIELRQFF